MKGSYVFALLESDDAEAFVTDELKQEDGKQKRTGDVVCEEQDVESSRERENEEDDGRGSPSKRCARAIERFQTP
jgi:hypothetical protein